MIQGIVDIGCNAIRFVIYANKTLSANELYKSNFRLDLTSLLNQDFDMKHQFYLMFDHIMQIFNHFQVEEHIFVATAVLRNHAKGKDFVEYMRKRYKIDIDILSGEEEARFAGEGLIYGIPDAHGLSADLGGGSLELGVVSNKNVLKIASYNIGMKSSMYNAHDNDNFQNENVITKQQIQQVINDDFKAERYDNIYFLGGSLCFLCRKMMDFTKYPIKYAHNFSVSSEEMLSFLSKIQKGKLYHTAGNAITVAQTLIELFQPKRVICSMYALKEGVRFKSLSEEEKSLDVIAERLKKLCCYNETVNVEKYLDLILRVCPALKDINKEDLNFEKLFSYAIILLSMESNFERANRAHVIVEYIISCNVPLPHNMRTILCVIVHFALNFNVEHNARVIYCSKKTIPKSYYYIAQIMGYILNIALSIDGKIFPKPSFYLEINDNHIEVKRVLEGTPSLSPLLPTFTFENIKIILRNISFAKKNLQKYLDDLTH